MSSCGQLALTSHQCETPPHGPRSKPTHNKKPPGVGSWLLAARDPGSGGLWSEGRVRRSKEAEGGPQRQVVGRTPRGREATLPATPNSPVRRRTRLQKHCEHVWGFPILIPSPPVDPSISGKKTNVPVPGEAPKEGILGWSSPLKRVCGALTDGTLTG